MGARRDDITGTERAQIAIETLSPHRPRGTVTRLARQYGVTRETIYTIGDKGEVVLAAGPEPGPHGPQPTEKAILVDRNRLVRGTVVLSEKGVSQRGVSLCLEELLDTRMSPGWVNAELAKVEQAAAVQNECWQPAVNETLSGDEIYSNDCPNLLVVGNDSLYIYALTRQPTCEGDTWGSVLLEMPDCPQFASDGGTGLAAGAKAAEMGHQLDWDHLLRPMSYAEIRKSLRGDRVIRLIQVCKKGFVVEMIVTHGTRQCKSVTGKHHTLGTSPWKAGAGHRRASPRKS